MDERSTQKNENRKHGKAKSVVMAILMFILLGTCFGLTCAKYISSREFSDSAQTAGWGKIEVKEHKVEYIDGKYEFTGTVISISNGATNKYENIEPDMIIPKDPFIVLSGNFEVSFGLYVRVTEVNFPATVKYNLEDEWNLTKVTTSGQSKVYTYQYVGDLIADKEIYILKDNQLIIEKDFVPKGNDFKLTFCAWIEQVN